jgi:hypothetical protein
MPAPKTLPVAQQDDRSGACGPTDKRRAPDMQVVTKGWWTLREERRPVEALEQEDRAERRQG